MAVNEKIKTVNNKIEQSTAMRYLLEYNDNYCREQQLQKYLWNYYIEDFDDVNDNYSQGNKKI